MTNTWTGYPDWVKKAFREAAEEKPRLKESAYYEDESFNDMVTYEFQKVIDNYDLEVIEAEPEFDYVNVCVKDKSSGMEFWLDVYMIEPTTGQAQWNQDTFDLKSSEDLIRQKLQNDEEFASSAFTIAEEAAEEAYEQNEKTANGRENGKHMDWVKKAFKEAEYYDVDSSTEKRAGISDKQHYKWKNSDAVKRALKRFIKQPITMGSKSFATVKNIKKDELEAALKRFNNAYSENFKILKYTFELSKIGY